MQTVTRLYQQFIPDHYNIHWDLTHAKTTRRIAGSTTIHGNQITEGLVKLHVHELDITRVAVNNIDVTDYTVDSANDELHIPHHDTGELIITVDFTVALTDTMHGIYPCYFTADGKRQEMYATQFESHHAREAFPCVDEPEAKATFSVSITHPTNLTALSNMPIATTEGRSEHATLTTFDITPKMSSYLVAFVVGNIHKKSTTTKRGVEVNVWASAAQAPAALDFALEASANIIDFYEDYFGVNYPLAKCDHVALPDFSSGAMENWGLITYREVCLLANKTTGSAGKHLIASVVAHELAHQWFGNLVTMQWWDYLWLNESFADFVEHIAVDALYPEYDTWLDFVTSRGIGALRRDAIDGVQSVQVTVQHPDEISTLFDGAIVYGKGARLMKMMRAYVGDEAFRAGLKNYFTKYAYQNTVGDNLWECLSEASGKDVGAFMNAWIMQPGYPMLSVDDTKLSQTQFFIGEHEPSNKLWPIPLSAQPAGDTPEIMYEQELAMQTRHDQRFNSGDIGHFVTKYTPEHLTALLTTVNKASTLDRLTLLNDQTLLVRAQQMPSAALLDILPYYRNETHDAVWDIIAMTLGELKKFVETDTAAEQSLRALSKTIAQAQYQRLGIDPIADEPLVDTKLRGTVLGMMLYSQDQTVIDATIERFTIDTMEDLPAETRSLIIGAAVRYGNDDSLVDKLMHIYSTTHSAELKEDLVSAITSTQSPEVAAKLLEDCKDSTIVRPQDVAPWFIYLIRNRYTRATAWQWLQGNWDWIVATFSGDKSFDEFPRYAASGLLSEEHFAEYKAFFEPMLSEVALKRTISMGISEIEARLSLIKADAPAVLAKLHAL